MPYWFTNDPAVADCPVSRPWGVVKEDRETVGCHPTRRSAIDQTVAVSVAECVEPRGEWPAND